MDTEMPELDNTYDNDVVPAIVLDKVPSITEGLTKE
jgi:hypothetical protein